MIIIVMVFIFPSLCQAKISKFCVLKCYIKMVQFTVLSLNTCIGFTATQYIHNFLLASDINVLTVICYHIIIYF